MTLSLIPTNTRTELAAESSAAADVLEALAAMPVASQEDLDFAGTMLVDVKAKFKALEEKRTAITKPINAAKREVDALFAPVLEPLKQAEGILKEKIAAYTVAREAERRAALTSGETNPLALVPAEQTKGVSVREVWDWEVENRDIIPREFMYVAEDAMHHHINSHKGEPPPIPGIRFYKRGEVRVRT